MSTRATPPPWQVYVQSRPHMQPSVHDLPIIVGEGGNIATVHACANPRRALHDPSLPDVGDVPGCEGWSVGLAIATSNAHVMALAPEMAEMIVRIAKMANMDSEELPVEEWDRGWADMEALAARIREGRP